MVWGFQHAPVHRAIKIWLFLHFHVLVWLLKQVFMLALTHINKWFKDRNTAHKKSQYSIIKAKPRGQRLSHRCQSSSAPSPACGSYWVSSEWGLGGRWLCPEGQIKGREVRQTDLWRERDMFDRRRVVWSPRCFALSLLCQAMRPSVKLTWFDTQQLGLVYQIQTKRRLKFMIASVT